MNLSAITSAKIGKVPVLAIGIPVVILGAVGSRFIGAKSSSDKGTVAAGDGTDVSQPIFFAKTTPTGMLAINPQNGLAYSPDGSVTYAPVKDAPTVAAPTNNNPVVPEQPTTPTAPPTVPKVQPPVAPTPNASTATKNTATNYGNFLSQSKNNTTKNVAAAYGLTESQLLTINPNLKAGSVAPGTVVKVRSDAVPYTPPKSSVPAKTKK